MLGANIGIDLGTTSIVAFVEGKGVVMSEPSAAAYEKESGKLLAVGKRAWDMIGKNPDSIRVVKPMEHGVVSDFTATKHILKYILSKICKNMIFKPNVVICVPSMATSLEKRTILDLVTSAGAAKACLIEEPLAAALGAGIKSTRPVGAMVVDIGGGTTKAAVLCYDGVVSARTGRVAGDEFDRAIISHLRAAYGLIIGEQSANAIKHRIGTAHPAIDRGTIQVSGRSVQNGLAITAEISSADVAQALRKPILRIIQLMRAALEAAPPELSSDVFATGPVLCGESALLPGLSKVIANGIGMRVTTAAECGDCVVKGLQKAIDEGK